MRTEARYAARIEAVASDAFVLVLVLVRILQPDVLGTGELTLGALLCVLVYAVLVAVVVAVVEVVEVEISRRGGGGEREGSAIGSPLKDVGEAGADSQQLS